MSERERTVTRNFRNPLAELLSPGTRLESPNGISCHVVGPTELGRITVAFSVNGREIRQDMWPARLRGFKVNGVTL